MNKQYTFDELMSAECGGIECKYGENETRRKTNTININGILIRGIDNIKILNSNFMVVVVFLNHKNEIARHVMSKNEIFKIEKDVIFNTYNYSFAVA